MYQDIRDQEMSQYSLLNATELLSMHKFDYNSIIPDLIGTPERQGTPQKLHIKMKQKHNRER